MRDEAPNAHHGRPAVVKLDAALLHLGLLIKLVPAEIEMSVAVVTDELGLGIGPMRVAIDYLGEDEEAEHLVNDTATVKALHEMGEGLETIGNILGTREADTGGSDKISRNSKHADTAVLEFGLAKHVELLLVAVRDEPEGIVHAEGCLDAELILEGMGLDGSGGPAAGCGGGEGSGRAGEEGEGSNGLHGKVGGGVCQAAGNSGKRLHWTAAPAPNVLRGNPNPNPGELAILAIFACSLFNKLGTPHLDAVKIVFPTPNWG